MIADQIGCARQWVSKIKEQVATTCNLTPNQSSIKETQKRVKGKDGKSYPAERTVYRRQFKRTDQTHRHRRQSSLHAIKANQRRMDCAGGYAMKCCLCGDRDAIHQEERRSGSNGELETWHYCPICFMELQRQLTDRDPVIAERYKFFLMFLHGGYRVQREFRGNQASGIRPALREFPDWSDRKIAEVCGVSPDFASRLHNNHVSLNDTSQPQTRTGRDGKQYPTPKPTNNGWIAPEEKH